MSKYVITYDIGTTGIKTCLIEIDKEMKILASATEGYNLYVDHKGSVQKMQESQERANRGHQLLLGNAGPCSC